MNPEIVLDLLLGSPKTNQSEVVEMVSGMEPKIIRWLAAHHPDNRTRRTLFRASGVEIGEGSVLNQNLVISDDYEPLVKIGKRVAIAPNVTIIAASDPNNSKLGDCDYVRTRLIEKEPVVIEDDAWVGANAILLPGVRVGRSSIVGAGAVVTRDVPAASIAVGVPAKVVRQLDIPPCAE